MGLEVIQTTPDEHDRNMARSLALIHIHGVRAFRPGHRRRDACNGDAPAPVRARFHHAQRLPQLLLDMHRYNPYAAGVRRELIDRLVRLDGELSSLEAEGMEH
jgi:prephenate dehydrogenase